MHASMMESCKLFMQQLMNTTKLNEEGYQRTSIFQTCVACQERQCTLIIDGGGGSNLE